MNQVKLLAYVRAAENFVKASYAGDRSKAVLARQRMKEAGISYPAIDECANIEEFQTQLDRLKKKSRAVLENQLMRSILEGQLPHIAARERDRGMPKHSPLSMAGYIEKLIAGDYPVFEKMGAYHALINGEWQIVKALVKGDKPKELFAKVKKLREKVGFDG